MRDKTTYIYGTCNDGTKVCAHVTDLNDFVQAPYEDVVYVHEENGNPFQIRKGNVRWTHVEVT
jgi:hypothetical protein